MVGRPCRAGSVCEFTGATVTTIVKPRTPQQLLEPVAARCASATLTAIMPSTPRGTALSFARRVSGVLSPWGSVAVREGHTRFHGRRTLPPGFCSLIETDRRWKRHCVVVPCGKGGWACAMVHDAGSTSGPCRHPPRAAVVLPVYGAQACGARPAAGMRAPRRAGCIERPPPANERGKPGSCSGCQLRGPCV